MGRAADRYVDRLLRGRRPDAFTPTDEEAAEIRTAVELAGSRTGDAEPREEFVSALRERLAAGQAQAAAASGEGAGASSGQIGQQPPAVRRLSPVRRRVLQAGAVAACGFAAGFATDRGLAPDTPGAPGGGQQAEPDLTPSHGVWHPVLAADDLPEGGVHAFDLGSVVGFVHRVGGRLRAVSGVCTHQACRLALDESRDFLVCPCHGATFALAGGPLHNYRSHQPLPPLPRLPVREHAGRIEVYGPAARPV